MIPRDHLALFVMCISVTCYLEGTILTHTAACTHLIHNNHSLCIGYIIKTNPLTQYIRSLKTYTLILGILPRTNGESSTKEHVPPIDPPLWAVILGFDLV
jgi:hypothetical protein